MRYWWPYFKGRVERIGWKGFTSGKARSDGRNIANNIIGIHQNLSFQTQQNADISLPQNMVVFTHCFHANCIKQSYFPVFGTKQKSRLNVETMDESNSSFLDMVRINKEILISEYESGNIFPIW